MKRLLQILLLAALPFGAFADGEGNVLLWFFENPEIAENGGGTVHASDIVGRGGEAAGKAVNALRISVTDAGGNKTYLGLGDPTGGYLDRWNLPDGGNQWKAGPSYADISGLSETGLIFTMELGYAEFDDSNDEVKWIVLAVSQSQTFQTLIAGGHVISSELSYQGSFNWDGGGFAVPEPSGGLMMMIGAALLALRRRRLR